MNKNNNEMILLTWYKGSEDSPWVVSLEDSNGQLKETTVGEEGYAAAGPRLTEQLQVMNSKTHRYPMYYDMRQRRNKVARTVNTKVLNNKIVEVETNVHFEKEIDKSFYQTPFTPLKESVEMIEDSRYIESVKTENHLISTAGYGQESLRTQGNKLSSTLLTEYAVGTNIFWLFMKPDSLKTIDGSTIEGYVEAYNWPEGYIVPDTIGTQNITDSQRTVTIDLLGLSSFEQEGKATEDRAKAYGLFGDTPEGPFDTSILKNAGKEAKRYLDSFISAQNIIAISVQYSRETNKPVPSGENVLGIAYGTDFKTLTEVENSILNGNFQAVNLNKSMLKESYSKNEEVRKKNPYAENVPLVEYLNQTESIDNVGISPAPWIKEIGINKPPQIEDYNESIKGYEEKLEDEEKIIEEVVKEQVEKDAEKGKTREDHYIEGYVNNDLAFVPPKDDRLESGEIYSEVYIPNPEHDGGALPYDYTHKVRIGDVMFEIPPLSIRADKEQANQSVPTMRSRNAIQKGIGNTRQVLTLELYFHDLDNINGHKYHAFTRDNGEQVFYYMDGLRSLLAQFMKSPFVPIDNDYVNNSLGVSNVAMRDIQAQTIEGFPEALAVTLVLEEVDLGSYLMAETSLGSIMNYPLYRWYYQQALNGSDADFNVSTQLPVIDHLDNTFSFRVADEQFLSDRNETIREFNSMKKPREFKRELEKQMAKNALKGEDEEGEVSATEKRQKDSRAARVALDSYNAYQDYYNSLPEETKEKYGPHELPILTRPGIENNLKNGIMQKIPQEEYDLALEVSRKVYGPKFNNSSIISYRERAASGNGRLKERFGIQEKDSILIGSYQVSDTNVFDKMIKKEKAPGMLQLKIVDKDNQKKLRDLLKESLDYGLKNEESNFTDKDGGIYKKNYYNDSTFFIPAGVIGGVDFLAALSEMAGEIEDEIIREVDAYTRKYNKMASIVNVSEDEVPMNEVLIDDIIPLSLSVGISNNLSVVQTQAAEAPSLQYLGGQQPEIQLSFSTTDEGVKQIDELFRQIGRYAKRYRVGLVSNFLEINNPLVNLFGIKSVLPNTFQINTVDGQPNEKIVIMTLVGFDKTQRRQEAIEAFTGGKTTKEMHDLHLSNFDPQVNALYIHEKIKYMELYPDLQLPTYAELKRDLPHLMSGVDKYENRRDQIFLDPDFYISTETTMRKELNELLGDKAGRLMGYRDDFGVVATTNPSEGQGITLDETMSNLVDEIDSQQEIVDPYLEWQGYDSGGLGEQTNREEDVLEAFLNGSAAPGEMIPIENSEVRDYLYEEKDGKVTIKMEAPSEREFKKWKLDESLEDIKKGEGNPSEVEVHQFLLDEVARIYGSEGTVTDKGLVKNDWWSAITKKAIDIINPLSGQNIQSASSLLVDWAKNDLPKKLSDKQLVQISANPIEFFLSQVDAVDLVKEGDEDVNALINGINEIIRPEEDDRNKFEKMLGIGYGKMGELKLKKKEQKGADGSSYHVAQIPSMRIFMYMKTLLSIDSGWKQFNEEGKPLITSDNMEDKPYKIGIMGAPVAKAKDKKEAQRLAWDWKYNITYSLEQIKENYGKAIENHYYEFHLRALDWATASHSGMAMPEMLSDPSEENDVPYTQAGLVIAPESLYYFNRFSGAYKRTAGQITSENALPIYSTPTEVNKEALGEELEKNEEEVDEVVEESYLTESDNFDQYDLEDKVKHMYVDMQQYNHVGRLVRAFPSFSMMLIDEGKWFQNFRTWDNFYGYNSLSSIDVYKSRKIAADTAIIEMSNIYGNLTSSETNVGPDLPAFFSIQFWDHYVLGKPTEEHIETRAEVYDQMMLQTGARVHLRMGYGSDASALPVMFNGSIAEMNAGEMIEITAQGDAVELQNVISGDPDDDNVGFLNRVQEPRRTIGELMTSKGNWLKEMTNVVTSATFFKEAPSGIVHFGSTVHSEKGGRAILPGQSREEFGESLQNVYSQNGMEQKSQWKNSSGTEIGKMEMLGKHTLALLTSLGGTLLGATAPFDEANVAVSYYGRTVWDVVQTFALASQDYVSTVRPFEFRSTLFFGKPHWMMQYRYDSDFIYDSDREMIDRTVKRVHEKTFMQAHVYNSRYNVITNNMMASEDGVYNNVIVTYDGRQAGPIQADSDIRLDKQRTIDVEANLLAPRKIEYFRAEDQALIYGQSALRDFMKDMYKGSYTIVGDPAVEPYDVVFLNDIVADINGIHLVKAVHHSMSGETGFITHIEPDAYIYNFDDEMGQLPGSIHSIGKSLSLASVMKGTGKLSSTIVVGSVVSKLLNVVGTKFVPSILGTVKEVADSRLLVGLTKHTVAKTYQMIGEMVVTNGSTVKVAATIKNAKTMAEISNSVKNTAAVLSAEMAKTSGVSAAEATFFQKTSNSLLKVAAKPGSKESVTGVAAAATKTGQMFKVAVTSKLFIYAVVHVTLEIATAWVGEWWKRKKQNAEAIKVVPLNHKGQRWTALMNWHKGSVLGDDPSLRDKLMNAEFFDKDIDPEVNEVLGNGLFKAMNFFFGE